MSFVSLLRNTLIAIFLCFIASDGFDTSRFVFYSPLNYSQINQPYNGSQLRVPYNQFIPFWARPGNYSNPYGYGPRWRQRTSRSLPPQGYLGGIYCLPPWRSYCNGTHNLDVGCLHTTDRPLFIHEYRKKGGFFSMGGPQKIINYPPLGVTYNKTISAIRVVDRKCNNTGGYAQILSGGVGHKNATLRLYAAEYRGEFHFVVYIFGLAF